jgi:uncharacterized protein YidB (DUF937 family)
MGMFDVLGGGSRRGGGLSPVALAVIGALAYRTLKGKGRLADMLGTGQPAPNTTAAGGNPSPTASAGGLGGLLSGLGGGGLGLGSRSSWIASGNQATKTRR